MFEHHPIFSVIRLILTGCPILLLLSLLHFIAQNPMALALAIPEFLGYPLTFTPPCLVFSKLSLKISCNAIPTKQSQSHPESEQLKEKRQRRLNAIKKILLKEAGLSSSQLTAVMSKDPSLFRRKSTERIQEAIQLFRDCGFTPVQIRKTILKDPTVLALKVENQLNPKIELFKSLGLAQEDVAHIISHQPRLLCASLHNNLRPTSLLFLTLFGSKANVSKAIRRSPGLLVADFETLKKKLKNMESTGLHQHEIKELLQKDPHFLCLSTDKIRKNIDFLTHTAGFCPNIVVKYPPFLNFSVEKRMKPRYKVFQYLNALQPSKVLTLSLVSMLWISEQDFTERFLIGNPEVTNLYEKYKGK